MTATYNKLTDFATKDTLAPGDPGKVVSGAEIDAELIAIRDILNAKLDVNSDTLTGVPLAPTATHVDPGGNTTTQVANCNFVTQSPIFAGTPRAPTAPTTTNTTQIATTEFVQQELTSTTGAAVQDTLELNSLFLNQDQTGWEIRQNGTTLEFRYNGVLKATIDTTGNVEADGDVTAFSTSIP